MEKIRLATRESALALWQTEHVAARLREAHPGLEVELVPMTTRGDQVLDQPLFARGNVATAGGCLASTYLAAWVIARLVGLDEARQALHYVAPVGEKAQYLAGAMAAIGPYLQYRTEA